MVQDHLSKKMFECQTKAGTRNSKGWIENLKNLKTWKHWKWSLEHAEQLLFSCLCSKVTDYKWNWQCVFFDSSIITLTCEFRGYRAGSRLKITPQNYLHFLVVSRHVQIALLSIVQLIIMVSLVTILHSLLVLVATSNSGQFIRDSS